MSVASPWLMSLSGSPAITDLRVECRAGGGITDRYVPLPVHVDAGHPAKQPVGSVVPILLLRWRSGNRVTRHVKLVPTHRSWPCVSRAVIEGSNGLDPIN